MTNLSDFLKVEKVRCVSKNAEDNLTIGKEYKVTHIIFGLQSDNNSKGFYDFDSFEPVLDQVENPLQGVELTPEFEAVEPVTAPRFQAGQKAYCPWLNAGRLVLLESNHADYLFAETVKGRQYFNNDGTSVDVTSHAQPDLFHATQENYELLCKLMPWVNFEAPPKSLTGSDLCRAMLNKGWKYVPCFVSNESDDFAQKMKLTDLIFALDGDRSKEFVGDDVWRYAVPIDLRTGEPLTEAVLDE